MFYTRNRHETSNVGAVPPDPYTYKLTTKSGNYLGQTLICFKHKGETHISLLFYTHILLVYANVWGSDPWEKHTYSNNRHD